MNGNTIDDNPHDYVQSKVVLQTTYKSTFWCNQYLSLMDKILLWQKHYIQMKLLAIAIMPSMIMNQSTFWLPAKRTVFLFAGKLQAAFHLQSC